MADFVTISGLERFKSHLSKFIGDEGFIKNTVNNLLNYYLKAETYTKAEVNTLIAAIKQFTYEVVAELPAASAETMHKIYLVPTSNPKTKNVKDEYITIDNGEGAETRYTWEFIGSTAVDLSNYYTKDQTEAAIATAISTAFAALPVVDVTVDGESVVDETDKTAKFTTASDADIDALFE